MIIPDSGEGFLQLNFPTSGYLFLYRLADFLIIILRILKKTEILTRLE